MNFTTNRLNWLFDIQQCGANIHRKKEKKKKLKVYLSPLCVSVLHFKTMVRTHHEDRQPVPAQCINQIEFRASNFCQWEISMHHHWQHDLGAHSEWQADDGRRWRPLAQATAHSPPTGCSAVLQGLNCPVCRAVRQHLRTSILFKLTILLVSDMLKTTGITRELTQGSVISSINFLLPVYGYFSATT